MLPALCLEDLVIKYLLSRAPNYVGNVDIYNRVCSHRQFEKAGCKLQELQSIRSLCKRHGI